MLLAKCCRKHGQGEGAGSVSRKRIVTLHPVAPTRWEVSLGESPEVLPSRALPGEVQVGRAESSAAGCDNVRPAMVQLEA